MFQVHHSSDHITWQLLSVLLRVTVTAVDTAWSLPASSRNGQAAFSLFQKHVPYWSMFIGSATVDFSETDRKKNVWSVCVASPLIKFPLHTRTSTVQVIRSMRQFVTRGPTHYLLFSAGYEVLKYNLFSCFLCLTSNPVFLRDTEAILRNTVKKDACNKWA